MQITEEIQITGKDKKLFFMIAFIICILIIMYGMFRLGGFKVCNDSGGVYAVNNKCYFPQYQDNVWIENDTIHIAQGFNFSEFWIS